ncbi:MAG TPA: hypothetical protein VG821_01590 [Rhizomicrobium sp.]|jgi:3-oxoacyl-[acyl-carrier protein] reductase|nr:hypothetical protein [Rhizomicrobium sp.]
MTPAVTVTSIMGIAPVGPKRTFESPVLDRSPQARIDDMRARIPMGRLGKAAECAALVCWPAGEECSFSTAARFDIFGGRTTY